MVVIDLYVVVVYCSTKEEAREVSDVDINLYETRVEVSTPRVHLNISPVLISWIEVLETYASSMKTLTGPGSK